MDRGDDIRHARGGLECPSVLVETVDRMGGTVLTRTRANHFDVFRADLCLVLEHPAEPFFDRMGGGGEFVIAGTVEEGQGMRWKLKEVALPGVAKCRG